MSNASIAARLTVYLAAQAPQEEQTTMADNVGCDIGNATVTVADDSGRFVFFPSFVAMTRRAYQGAALAGGSYHHVTYKDQHYIVGGDALDVPGHDNLMAESLTEDQAYRRYLEDRSFVAFLAGVGALYPDAPNVEIVLGTGLPLSLYEPHGATVAQRYQGRHEYLYLGRPHSLVVRTARVFGEGLEALRLLPPDERMGRIALHDVGGRTYGVVLFNDGVIKSRRAYDAGIDRLLSDIPIVSNDPGARWHIQQEMRSDPKAHAALRKELSASINGALATAERKQQLSAAERHLVIGGGAPDAAPVIKARYGKPVTVVNKAAPERVNALAYAMALQGVQ